LGIVIDMYELAKKLLFALPPEISHDLALDWLGAANRLGLLKLLPPPPQLPVTVMGLTFTNPVGLAAGLDKNADYFNALGQLGFGFVEIGTVTPKAQPGNPEPRMFRLVDEKAIINRMGFNNKGLEYFLQQLTKRRYAGILGINIGKNKHTPDDQALDDYVACLRGVYRFADYITVNISSPNTPGLRNLQFGKNLSELLAGIKLEQSALQTRHGRYVPIAVKIAPDMTVGEIEAVAETLIAQGMDAVIATNTTVGREGVEGSALHHEAGGLSGAPLAEKSTAVVNILARALHGKMPIIGVGGILTGDDAKAKLDAGASLVQIYSGLVYRGPALINEIIQTIRKS
jgi:dihydroorotate dehydrogenase